MAIKSKGGGTLLGPLLFALFVSCLAPSREIPLSPATLFSIESEFLQNADAAAVKGSIEYRDRRRDENADFRAIFCGIDSIYFLTEGPFKADLFQLIVTGPAASLKSRDSRDWQTMESFEPVALSEYDIAGIRPIDLGALILPQYFLQPHDTGGRKVVLHSVYGDWLFRATPSPDQRSFMMETDDPAAKAFYSRGRRFEAGIIPTEIEIIDDDRGWRMKIIISEIKINPKINPQIWRTGN